PVCAPPALPGPSLRSVLVSFFTAPPTPEIYTLSLHERSSDLRRRRTRPSTRPRWPAPTATARGWRSRISPCCWSTIPAGCGCRRSEEHTSELQSRENLVCRLLLEKKKKDTNPLSLATAMIGRR